MITITEVKDKFYIIESRTGVVLAGPYDVPDLCDVSDPMLLEINRKVTSLQHIYDTFHSAFMYLKDNGRAPVAMLFASCLDIQHNTDGATIIRNIREGLETFEKNARSDGRNVAALDWIKKGKSASSIPFI